MSPDFTNGFDVPDDQKERHYDVFEEVALITHYLRRVGMLADISRARALCPPPFRPLRRHRLCGRPAGLCH